MSDFSLACTIRRNKQLLNTPLPRFNTTSPYFNAFTGVSTGITQQQLDMRRKSEILKYESNRMSTQTNNMTKNQKWSQIVQSKSKLGRLYDDTASTGCPVPTTSSGIPGPMMYLYEDPTIPLYNYLITRTYAIVVPNPNGYWETTINTNIGLNSGMTLPLASVSINPNIYKNQVSFSLDIPFGIHCEGRYNANPPPQRLSIRLTSVRLDVYCNGTILPNLTKTLSSSVSTFGMDISLNSAMDAASAAGFSATQYLGLIHVSNIQLNVSPIYVFDFRITPIFTTTIVDPTNPTIPYGTTPELYYFGNNQKSTLQTYLYMNMTKVIPTYSNGCNITYKTPSSAMSDPTVSGT